MFDGFPIKYSVEADVVDCKASRAAIFGRDYYASKKIRMSAERVPEADLSFKPIPAHSIFADALPRVCSATVPLPSDPEGAPHPGETSIGTAWVTEKGYLVTASHVVNGGAKIDVYTDGKIVGAAKVVANDPETDVAILKFTPNDPMTMNALALAEHGASLGKSVFTLGYPEPELLGQQVKMTAGEISSTSGPQDNARLLQMSAPIQPGNSGGPVIEWDGSVVGVADSSIEKFEDANAQNVNYAVKASYVRAMLEDLPDLGGYAYVRATAGHDALVAAARKAVFMLVVTQ